MTDDASPEIDKLIEDLKSDEWDVSRNAVKVLIGDVRAVEPLIKTVRDGTLSADEVGEVLGEIGEPAMESLIKALKDKNEDVRTQAQRALGRIGDARAVEPLIKAFRAERRGGGLFAGHWAKEALKKLGHVQ
jgi:HEAT repeat protein